jgi:hypothetical protein
MDFIQTWDLYYHYNNAIGEDSSALDGSDCEIILKHVKDLLEHVKYQDEVIAAVSREVSIRPYLNVYGEAKHW